MPRWIRAERLPKHCEGFMAWRFDGKGEPYLCSVPKNYSRDTHHCGGIWFLPIRIPTKPPTPPDNLAATR